MYIIYHIAFQYNAPQIRDFMTIQEATIYRLQKTLNKRVP